MAISTWLSALAGVLIGLGASTGEGFDWWCYVGGMSAGVLMYVAGRLQEYRKGLESA